MPLKIILGVTCWTVTHLLQVHHCKEYGLDLKYHEITEKFIWIAWKLPNPPKELCVCHGSFVYTRLQDKLTCFRREMSCYR